MFNIVKEWITIFTPVAKEALSLILILLFVTLIVWFVKPVFAVIPIGLILFILFFFRDPERKISANPGEILAPADGKIMAITEDDDRNFFNGHVKKVTIFLSIFNVHINRSPIRGKVVYQNYRPGKYLPAYQKEALSANECNTIGIENEQIKVLVNQIAGILARRIVCRCKVGDFLEQGERFGLIRFGSCTEIILPASVEILVNRYDIVKGGISVIGVFKPTSQSRSDTADAGK